MIRKVGVIYQDVNSYGFLEGLKERLGCRAELIPPPTAIGTPSVMPRRQLKEAWRYFQKQGVDLIVRLTDADGKPWTEIRRKEMARIPADTSALWIFAVAVECLEDWLALDWQYLARALNLDPANLCARSERIDIVKNAIKRSRPLNEPTPDVVRRIVRDAPREVVKKWLKDGALEEFYKDCRAAANRKNCETDNDMEGNSA